MRCARVVRAGRRSIMQSGNPIPSGARSEKIASGSRKSIWRTDAEYGSDVERRLIMIVENS